MEWYIWALLIFFAVTSVICFIAAMKGSKTDNNVPLVGAIEICYDDPKKDFYNIVIDDLDLLDKNDLVMLKIRKM